VPKFNYIASNPTGETARGVLEASSKTDLAQKLKTKGLFLVSCRSDESQNGAPLAALPAGAEPLRLPGRQAGTASSNGAAASPASATQNWLNNLLHPDRAADPNVPPSGSVPLKELVVLTRQLSISINAGMSFVEALQGLASNTQNPKLGWILRKVLDDVLSGKRFSDALAAHPDVFRPVYVSMTAAGEAGGFMPDALNRTAEFLEKEIELGAKIKSAMVYPAVIAVVASVVVIGMMAFIVPTFVKVFKDMNAPLPAPTRALIVISSFTRKGGFLLPFAFVGLLMFSKRLRKTNEPFRVFWDDKILAVPVLGKMITLEVITRFIRTLASLVSNGVMALQAISVARQVVENRTLEKVVDEIFASVQQGNGISPVLYKSKHFPVLVANMVATGEKTGAIPEVLNKMADYYDAEVSAAIRDLLTLMEPLLIVCMAVIVGFVIMGLMLPTFQMSSLVGN
jgi:type II secretory pathway component PulF